VIEATRRINTDRSSIILSDWSDGVIRHFGDCVRWRAVLSISRLERDKYCGKLNFCSPTHVGVSHNGAMKGSGMSYTVLNINLADLTAIKITCAQCRASAEFPVARLQGDPPERCFHCRAEWFVAQSSQATALEHLFRALGELRADGASACRVQLVMMQDPGFLHTREPV